MPDRDDFINKPLPSDPVAEKAIIGGIILDNSLVDDVLVKLEPEDFYSPLHKRVFIAMSNLVNRSGKAIDPIEIGNELKLMGDSLEMIGGVATIVGLIHGVPHITASVISSYCDIVKEKSKARKLIRICNKLVTDILAEDAPLDDIFESAENQLFELSDIGKESGFSDISSLVGESIEKAQTVAQMGSALVGYTTGFAEFDSITLGLQKQDLIIIAARPSMGKTALGLGVAINSALRDNKCVAVFSMEMSKESLTARAICSEAEISSQIYRAGLMNENQWERLHEVHDGIASGRLFIDDTPALTVAQIRQKLRRQIKKSNKKFDWIMLDYLQLMRDPRAKDRQQEVSSISRDLKQLAKDFDIPVVALSQLNRNPEGRTNHRPNLGDLRESGAIEQDADVVAFIFREEMYPDKDGNINGIGEAEIIFAKQRNGPTGTVKLGFDKNITKFSDFISDF